MESYQLVPLAVLEELVCLCDRLEADLAHVKTENISVVRPDVVQGMRLPRDACGLRCPCYCAPAQGAAAVRGWSRSSATKAEIWILFSGILEPEGITLSHR